MGIPAEVQQFIRDEVRRQMKMIDPDAFADSREDLSFKRKTEIREMAEEWRRKKGKR